ncbi:MAG TPA: 2Fe-2S iron-sulfur cluster-binding protein [Tepidisphaeraceae bacterium]|nr:2Fe-2S iron-sulfur cluster-binding protein [Tepidisphaeraceae bacterium]
MTQDSASDRFIHLRIRRQDRPESEARCEEFAIPYRPNLNVIACLQYIAAHPVTRDGTPTTPVVYDSNCLEEVCGACTMRINGRTRQACSALIDKLEPTYVREKGSRDHALFNRVDYSTQPPMHPREGGAAHEPITLEPLSKFPLVRDLLVDRSRLFNDLKRTKCWVPIDGTYDLGPGPEVSKELQEERYVLSRCISCASCLEACPQYTPVNHFVGAAIFSQVKLFNIHPTGKALKDERLDVMMGEGGIGDCSKAGNCVVVCPKEIPNLESIATIGRQTTVAAIKRFFGG